MSLSGPPVSGLLHPETLIPGEGGWVRFESIVPALHDPLTLVFVRFEDHSGRLVPVDIVVSGLAALPEYAPPLDSQTLRSVPLGRIEAWANSPEFAAILRRHLPHRAPKVRDLDALFRAFDIERMRPGHWAKDQLQMYGRSGSKGRPPKEARVPISSWWELQDARLEVPPGRGDYGADFYRAVATAYGRLSKGGQPALNIAEANGVPVSTAYRWIKEARRRGFLPAGRPGKVG